MKAIKTWLATIAVLLCSLTANAHDFEVDGIYYNITSSTDLTVAVTFRGSKYDSYSNEYSGEVVVPHDVIYNGNTYRVMGINGYAFYYCRNLVSITISEGVTSIGYYAFYGCSSLTTINIPESVTSIGNYAFCLCTGSIYISSIASWCNISFDGTDTKPSGDLYLNGILVEDLIIPSGVTSIASNAFYKCSSLTSITIPASVTSIGRNAFYRCTSLKEVIFEDGSEPLSMGYNDYYLGNHTRGSRGLFYDCPLEKVYLGRDLSYSNKSYEYSPFYKEDRCPTISLGDNITSITPNLYYGNINLVEIILPDGVTSIGDGAFSGCTNLVSVYIPDGVTSIGDEAFSGCSNLTSVNIPEDVTSIGDDIFEGCDVIPSVHISSVETWCNNIISGHSPHPLSYAYNLYLNGEIVADIVIPDGMTSIGDSAFYNCNSLTSITIPESVTSIGNCAFDNCTALKEVIFEGGSETLTLGYNDYYGYGTGHGLFYDCPLESVYLNRNLSYSSGSSYGYSPFYNTTKLTSLIIGENVTSIESSAFSGCSSLTSITIPESVTSIESSAFSGCSSLTTITIPKSVMSIGNNTFNNCVALKEVIFRDGDMVLSLGYNATSRLGLFSDCPLEKVYLGRNLSLKLDYYPPFSNKDELNSLVIGTEVTDIGYRAFEGCSSLISIVIPNSVTNIGNFAFRYCSGLKSLTIPESVTSIGEYAFTDCTGELVLNCNISSSGLNFEDRRFVGSKFSKITIGDNVTLIGDNAFRKANSEELSTLVIGAGITSMGGSSWEGAFRDCEIVKTIWKTDNLPSGSDNARGKINYIANDQYASYSGFKAYPMLNSMFEVDGVTYVPISLSERTCDVIDCTYNLEDSIISIKESVSYRNIPFEVQEINSYAFYENKNIKEANIANKGNVGRETFYGCDSLRKVSVDWASDTNINSGLGSIEDGAFGECAALTDVVLNDGVFAIGDQAFKGCTSLESITLPEKLVFLGGYVFENCTAFSSFVLPASVELVGYALFAGCNSLKSIRVTEGNANYDSRNDCNAIIATNNNTVVAACNVTTIPTDVTSVGNWAFEGCNEMTTISVSKEVMSVGDYAFLGCSKLANIIIEDRTKPLTLGSNGSNALFSDCPLDSVYLGGKLSYSASSSKGYSPFSNNESLRTVVIANKEETIYPYEFYNCSSLKSVTIGDGVTSIGDYAFSGCSSLEKFNFGSRTQEIGINAFAGCGKITEIVSSAMVPPLCAAGALDGLNKWECVLCVPAGYKAAYQTADQWKEFLFIEDVVELEQYKLIFVIDDEVYCTATLVCNEDIVYPQVPTREGYTFSGWSELPKTMPAEDMTISGNFVVNTYKVRYYIEDELVHTEEVAYGEKIPEYIYVPTDGGEFLGWEGDVYETMPAYDITYVGKMEYPDTAIKEIMLNGEDLMFYDLQGRRVLDVENMKAGLYIVNGRKVMIK